MAYDRAAIMRDAHKRFRDGKRLGLGWTFSQCLSTAWRAAKARRKAIYEALHPETKHEAFKGNQHACRQVGDNQTADRFTADTAAKTGQSERRVQRDAERVEKIGSAGFKPYITPSDGALLAVARERPDRGCNGGAFLRLCFRVGVRVDDCRYVSAIVWTWPAGSSDRALFQSPERRRAHDREMDHHSYVSSCDFICWSYDVSLRTRLSVLALGSWQKDMPSMRETPKPASQVTTNPSPQAAPALPHNLR